MATTKTDTRKVGEPVTDFGAPKPITLDQIPAPARKGTRASNVPAMTKWLEALKEGSTYQLPDPVGEDDSHPVNRVTQFKKVAASVAAAKGLKMEVTTRPQEVGKRYFIYVTVSKPEPAAAAS